MSQWIDVPVARGPQGEAMNAPIPVSEALKLLSMAIEDCDKATPGPYAVRETDDHDEGHESEPFRLTVVTDEDEPWSVFEACLGIEGAPERANASFACLARATMRPMLEYFLFGPWPRVEVHQTDSMYPPLAALRDHYDQTRPDWRTR